jgi:hypothetical protein
MKPTTTSGSASEVLHTYGVYTSSGLQSNEAVEEDELELEIHQCGDQWVEFPLTAGTTSNERAKPERRGLERGMNEPRGSMGRVYIGVLGRWHLPGMSLP